MPKGKKPPRIWRHRSSPPLMLRTPTPLQAVIVAVDAAKNSGVAVFELGKLTRFGEVKAHDKPHERMAWLDRALHRAIALGVPCGLVVEVPWGGYQSSARSLTASAQLWRDSWLLLGAPKRHIVEVTAGEWRRSLFGRASMPRETARKFEGLHAARIVTRDMPCDTPLEIRADAAAAICLGSNCTRSVDLQRALECLA